MQHYGSLADGNSPESSGSRRRRNQQPPEPAGKRAPIVTMTRRIYLRRMEAGWWHLFSAAASPTYKQDCGAPMVWRD